MRFREWMTKKMEGRYGSDSFSRFLLIAGMALWLLGILLKTTTLPGRIVYTIGFVLIVYNLTRTWSRNISKRQAENEKYLSIKWKVTGFFRSRKARMSQRKDYRFFACPKCKQMIRVPRGKGNIRIRCPKCGETFVRKS